MSIRLIEFQFFDGCPNANDTLQNLREAMLELGISADRLKLTEVPNVESAKILNFQGSPSILVDGKDICTGEEPVGFSYTCRIYEYDDKRSGMIPKEIIKARLLGK